MADIVNLLAAAAGAAGGEETDPNFNQTVLLLHGDGTDGSQNNTFIDGSTNNFTITRNGNSTQGAFSPFSQTEGSWSNYFNDTKWLNVPDSNSWFFDTSDFTIEFFIYFNAFPVGEPSCPVSQWSSSDRSWTIYINATGITFSYSTTGSDFVNRNVGVTNNLNEWMHFAICRIGTDLYILKNGSLLGTFVAPASIINSSRVLHIGTTEDGNYAPVIGHISNLRILKGTALYTTSYTVPTDPLTAIANTVLLTCQSSKFVDNSTNNFTLTVNGTPKVTPLSPFAPTSAYDPAVNGGSGYFDGSGDYLDASSTLKDLGTGDFCIEFWTYPADTNAMIIDTRDDSNVGWMIYVDTTIRFYHASTSRVTSSIQLNAWNHVAVTRSSGTLRLFINGVQADSTTYTASLSDGDDFRIASKTNVSSTVTDLSGYLSSLRIVAGSAVYTSAFTPPTAPVTAIANTSLLLNFTNAGIFDSTAKNNLETVGNAQIDTTTKKYGTGSMEFDGTGDYLDAPASQDFVFGAGDFTIEAWAYTTDNTRESGGISQRIIDIDTRNTGIWVQATTGYIAYNAGNSSPSSTLFPENQWNHVALSRSGTSLKLFLNGVEVASATNSTSLGSNGALTIGSSGQSADGAWLGFIDDVRITKGVARYTSAFTPPTKAFPDL